MGVNLRIFPYNDGEADVFGDPTDIDFELERLGVFAAMRSPRLTNLPRAADGMVDVEAMDPAEVQFVLGAYHDLEPLLRQAFRIKPFDRATGKGLLYGEVVDLFMRYMDWQQSVKKNTAPQPDSTLVTA